MYKQQWWSTLQVNSGSDVTYKNVTAYIPHLILKLSIQKYPLQACGMRFHCLGVNRRLKRRVVFIFDWKCVGVNAALVILRLLDIKGNVSNYFVMVQGKGPFTWYLCQCALNSLWIRIRSNANWMRIARVQMSNWGETRGEVIRCELKAWQLFATW